MFTASPGFEADIPRWRERWADAIYAAKDAKGKGYSVVALLTTPDPPPQGETSLVEFEGRWLDELVLLWRASFEAGVGVADPHSIEEQRQYFLSEVLPRNEVRMAMRNAELVGFVAASRESVSHLYVRVGHQRQGIGAELLAWAKAQSRGSLWLYTFACNSGARLFYERNGFVAVAQGFEPTWQLEDIKYQWFAPERIDHAWKK